MKKWIMDNFFVIDSNNCAHIKNRFLGYGFLNNQPVEGNQLDLSEQYDFDGRGAYLYIKREQNCIVIKQDFMGSFGLYFYQRDGYFAVSNSFVKLVEYLQSDHELSMNEDYANFLLVADVCFVSYSETIVNEINIIPRNAVVNIDVKSGDVWFEYIDYKEYSVDLDSKEAFDILDGWYERWIKTFRYAMAEGNSIMEDLSGGFDSRLPLVLMLNSGIDMNGIFVKSLTDGLHTHAEDFEIATEIAEHYGFELNKANGMSMALSWLTQEEQMQASLYTKLSFHKQLYYKSYRTDKRRYVVGGSGGEIIRGYWDYDFDGFVKKQYGRCGWLSGDTRKKVLASIMTLLTSAQRQLVEKYHLDNPNSHELVDFFFMDVYSRNHFGKDAVENYIQNSFRLSPLLDPYLCQIKVRNEEFSDKNLLMAVIFERYGKELLNFKFDSNRSIAAETLEYAKILSDKYPVPEFDLSIEENKYIGRVQNVCINCSARPLEEIRKQEIDEYITSAFLSPKLRNMIEWGAPCSGMYEFAMRDYNSRTYMPLSSAYTMIAIAKTANDCYSSGKGHRCMNIMEFIDDLSNDRTWSSVMVNNYYAQIERTTHLENEVVHLKEAAEKKAKDDEQRLKKSEQKAKDDGQKLKESEQKIKKLGQKSRSLEQQLRVARDEQARLQKRIDDVENSTSYKLGFGVTKLPRKVKDYMIMKKSADKGKE